MNVTTTQLQEPEKFQRLDSFLNIVMNSASLEDDIFEYLEEYNFSLTENDI